jgi:hypothetical protein
VRALLLARAFGVVVDVVAELRADDDLVANVAECLVEDGFGIAAGVGVGGIEEGDPEVKGTAQEGNAVGAVADAPPGGADGPDAEASDGLISLRPPQNTFV